MHKYCICHECVKERFRAAMLLHDVTINNECSVRKPGDYKINRTAIGRYDKRHLDNNFFKKYGFHANWCGCFKCEAKRARDKINRIKSKEEIASDLQWTAEEIKQMTANKIDWNKPIRFKNYNHKVEFVCYSQTNQPIIRTQFNSIDDWKLQFYEPDVAVIENVPQKKSGWINIYKRHDEDSRSVGTNIYPLKEQADHDGKYRMACIEIEWEE